MWRDHSFSTSRLRLYKGLVKMPFIKRLQSTASSIGKNDARCCNRSRQSSRPRKNNKLQLTLCSFISDSCGVFKGLEHKPKNASQKTNQAHQLLAHRDSPYLLRPCYCHQKLAPQLYAVNAQPHLMSSFMNEQQ